MRLLLVLLLAASVVTEADLREIEDRSTVELTTIGRKSGKPRAVTIWFVHDAGRIFLQSGQDGMTHWYRNLKEDPRVILDFDDLVLHGHATPLNDPAETERVHGLFSDKYLAARVSGWFGGGFGHGEVVRVDRLEEKSEDRRQKTEDGIEGTPTISF